MTSDWVNYATSNYCTVRASDDRRESESEGEMKRKTRVIVIVIVIGIGIE